MASKSHFLNFLEEEKQARLSSTEDVCELGFRVRNMNVQALVKNNKQGTQVSKKMFEFMRGRTTSKESASTNFPCIIKILSAPESKGEPSPESFTQIYSATRQSVNNAAMFTELLLLPLKNALGENEDGSDRYLKFELWVATSAKKSTPDVKGGIFAITLSSILKQLSGASNRSEWVTFNMLVGVNEDGTEKNSGENGIFAATSSLNPTFDFCQLDIRVALPSRFVSVPRFAEDSEEGRVVQPHDWRAMPPFSGEELKGMIHRPVSRAFQDYIADESAPRARSQSVALEEARKSQNVNTMRVVEFREEMGEMPINLLVPCIYLDVISGLLEKSISPIQVVSRNVFEEDEDDLGAAITSKIKLPYTEKWKKEFEMLQKNMRSRFGTMYESTQKDLEAQARYFDSALRAKDEVRDRMQDMKRLFPVYRDMYQKVVDGGWHSVASADAPMDVKMVKVKSLASLKPIPRVVSTNRMRGISKESSSSAVLHAAPHASLGSTVSQSGLAILASAVTSVEEREASSEQEAKQEAKQEAETEPGPDEGDEDEKELAEGEHEKKLFEELTGVKAIQDKVVSFRKSTTRKDESLKYLPINLHLQVLIVRELRVAFHQGNGASSRPPAEQKRKITQRARASIVAFGALIGVNKGEGGSGTLSITPAKRRADNKRSNALTIEEDEEDEPKESSSPRAGVGSDAFPSPAVRTVRKGRMSFFVGDAGAEDVPPSPTVAASVRSSDQDEARGAHYYETTTVGAPCAHAMRTAGLWTLHRECLQLRAELNRLQGVPPDKEGGMAARIDVLRKVKEHEALLSSRLDVVLPQAIATVMASVLARVYSIAATASSFVDSDEVAKALLQQGFFIGWESLLSTHASEIYMLEDMYYACRFISERLQVELKVLDETNRFPSPARGSVSSNDEPPPRDPTQPPFFSFRKSLKKIPVKDSTVGFGPGGENDLHVWVGTLHLPEFLVMKLPPSLRAAITFENGMQVDAEEDALLKVTLLVFTQGINEYQSLVNMRGRETIQEEINRHSMAVIRAFCAERFEFATKNSPASSQKALADARMQAIKSLAELSKAVERQTAKEKDVKILEYAALLVRWLDGIRIMSCKSAKDRTAMSLTLEEGRILHDIHHSLSSDVDLANLLREHGTRLINVHKNTGAPKYAFNIAQMVFLPEKYRPPPNTAGGGLFSKANAT